MPESWGTKSLIQRLSQKRLYQPFNRLALDGEHFSSLRVVTCFDQMTPMTLDESLVIGFTSEKQDNWGSNQIGGWKSDDNFLGREYDFGNQREKFWSTSQTEKRSTNPFFREPGALVWKVWKLRASLKIYSTGAKWLMMSVSRKERLGPGY